MRLACITWQIIVERDALFAVLPVGGRRGGQQHGGAEGRAPPRAPVAHQSSC